MSLYWYVMLFDALTIIEHRGTQNGVNSMHSKRSSLRNVEEIWRLEIRHAGAVVLPTSPQRDERTPGEGGHTAKRGIVSYTGCIDHTPLYLAGQFCLYHINAGRQPSNTKLDLNKLRGTPCDAIIEVPSSTVPMASSRRRRWYV
jgi:hypothetical protein